MRYNPRSSWQELNKIIRFLKLFTESHRKCFRKCSGGRLQQFRLYLRKHQQIAYCMLHMWESYADLRKWNGSGELRITSDALAGSRVSASNYTNLCYLHRLNFFFLCNEQYTVLPEEPIKNSTIRYQDLNAFQIIAYICPCNYYLHRRCNFKDTQKLPEIV